MKKHEPKSETSEDNMPMQLQALQSQVVELTEALQRERADSVNIRRHHEQQISSLKSIVKSGVVRDLLPVIDNFERAIKHLPANASISQPAAGQDPLVDWVEGVRKILAQFEKTLSAIGVQRIKTVGEPFDPRFHEAVSMEEGDGLQEIVCEEIQPGYILGDEVIRHAMVRVRA